MVERYKARIKPELLVPRVDWRFGGGGRMTAPPKRRRVPALRSVSSVY
jgi:hypothetical protein